MYIYCLLIKRILKANTQGHTNFTIIPILEHVIDKYLEYQYPHMI